MPPLSSIPFRSGKSPENYGDGDGAQCSDYPYSYFSHVDLTPFDVVSDDLHGPKDISAGIDLGVPE